MNYNLIIKNVKIIDGISDIPFYGDIGVRNSKIHKIGAIENSDAERVIDGSGLTACPGFFDIHSHIDRDIMNLPTADNLILQGITSSLTGHCGSSNAPAYCEEYNEKFLKKRLGARELNWKSFSQMLKEMEKAGMGVNVFALVGTNMLRSSAMGMDFNREASEREIEKMCEYTEEAMKAGAYGVSYSGDAGVPSHWMSFDELVEILKVCQKYDGVFSPHTRHHQFQYISGKKGSSVYGLYDGPKGELFVGRYHGLLEASELCEAANKCRLHISHITPSTIVYHPHSPALDRALAEATLEDIIDAPISRGLDVTFDVLCSEYSIGAEKKILSDIMSGVIIKPDWMEKMTEEDFAAQAKKNDFRRRFIELADSGNIKFGMLHPVQDPYWFECYRVIRSSDKKYEGRLISEIAFAKGHPTVKTVYNTVYEVICDIIASDPASTWALVKDKREYEAMKTFMRHPLATVGTDMGNIIPAKNASESFQVETSRYGYGPYMFQGYIQYLVNAVRRDCILTLPQAVKRITSIPAKKVLKLDNYGVLSKGAWANMVLLDEGNLNYVTDYTKPNTHPSGIEYVFVNGTPALEKGELTGQTAGRLVRHGGKYE